MHIPERIRAHGREIAVTASVVGALAVGHLGLRAPTAHALQSTPEPTPTSTVDPMATAQAQVKTLFVPLAINRHLGEFGIPMPEKTATLSFTNTPENTTTPTDSVTPENTPTPSNTSNPSESPTNTTTPTTTIKPSETPTATESVVSTKYPMVYLYGNLGDATARQNIRYTGPEGSFDIAPAGVGASYAEPWVVRKASESNPKNWAIGYTLHQGINQRVFLDTPGGVNRNLTKELGPICYEPDFTLNPGPLVFIRDGAVFSLASPTGALKLIAGSPASTKVQNVGENVVQVSSNGGVYTENLETGEIKVEKPFAEPVYLTVDASSRFTLLTYIEGGAKKIKVIDEITHQETAISSGDPRVNPENMVSLLIDNPESTVADFVIFRGSPSNRREIWSYDIRHPENPAAPLIRDAGNDTRDVSAVHTIEENQSVEDGHIVVVDSTDRSDGRLAIVSLADGHTTHIDAAGTGFFRSPRWVNPSPTKK